MFMGHVLQLLIYGLQLGSLYALLAMGYTLVFGIIKMINLAHADLMMLGAFGAYFLYKWFGATGSGIVLVPLVLVGTMLFGAAVGFVIERFAYKPLRGDYGVASMVAAIGVQLFIENLMRCLPGVGALPKRRLNSESKYHWRISISSVQIVVIAIAALLLLFMQWLCYSTSLGKQMQAVSVDKDASALMGINVNFVISFTFFLAGMSATIAGALVGGYYQIVYPNMGFMAGLKSFCSSRPWRNRKLAGSAFGRTDRRFQKVWQHHLWALHTGILLHLLF
ncbi:MAG: branched-chain amino acid ABC transporter permease [Lachnospiraceae bacterium]